MQKKSCWSIKKKKPKLQKKKRGASKKPEKNGTLIGKKKIKNR
jgi:hypothetical protein